LCNQSTDNGGQALNERYAGMHSSNWSSRINNFSTIDLKSGFWQMMPNPECRKYTAFTITGVGQFECNVSPMGLLGAPGSFQRLMEIVVHNLSNIFADIDDLLVHTKDHGKHLEILDELFTRLRKLGLKINLPIPCSRTFHQLNFQS
jgi:hypothetical protein